LKSTDLLAKSVDVDCLNQISPSSFKLFFFFLFFDCYNNSTVVS